MIANPPARNESRMQGDRKSEHTVSHTSNEEEKKKLSVDFGHPEVEASIKKLPYATVEFEHEEPTSKQSSSSSKKFHSTGVKDVGSTLRQTASPPKSLDFQDVKPALKQLSFSSAQNVSSKSIDNEFVEPALNKFKSFTNMRQAYNINAELTEVLDKLNDKQCYQYTINIPKTLASKGKTKSKKTKDVKATSDNKDEYLMQGDVGAHTTIKEMESKEKLEEYEANLFSELPTSSSKLKLMECGDLEVSSSSESLYSCSDDVEDDDDDDDDDDEEDGPLRIITEKDISAPKKLLPTESLMQRLRESKEQLFRTISEQISKFLPGTQ